ncbi:MAG: nicotinamide mononucleotide transporter [Clostridia bacterium]
MNILSVENIMVSIGGYPLSWIEFTGTILYFASVWLVARFHIWMPAIFPAPADYPFLDAFTTVSSFAAMYFMTRRRTESWLWCLIIDAIGIGLYWIKDVRFIAIQYIALFFMAAWGLWRWMATARYQAQGVSARVS